MQSEAEFARREQLAADRQREARLMDLLRQVGDRYAGCRLANWRAATPKQREVREAVREWASRWPERAANGEGLVLYGPVGTGKDHLAFAAVRHLVERHGLSVRWLNGRAFVGEVRDRIEEGRSERSLISGLTVPDIVVISDPLPPVGELTIHQADMMYRLVHSRYEARRVTVCTLNVAGDDEADRRLGTATWDRLCDQAWKIACMWETSRKPAREVKP